MLQHWLTPISISGTTHFIEHHFRDHITSQIQNKIPLTLQNTPKTLIDISLTPLIERLVHIVPTPPPTTTAKRISGCRHLGSDQFINSIIWSYSDQGSWFFFFEARQLLFKTYIMITVVLQIDIAMRTAVLRDWKVQCLEHVHVRGPHREATSSPRTCTWSAVKWLRNHSFKDKGAIN